MKALSKPISSPSSKGEKFPPPLMMRFLRSNVGSRSRGRLRATPMFYLRSKRNGTETTQEPSSPKVTCIGQVRVRRSSKSKPKTTPKKGRTTTGSRTCWWLKRTFCWHRVSSRLHKPPRVGVLRRFFRKWILVFCTGYCNKVLIRCRSAPYRASSLAGRFWGSPLAAAAEAEEDVEDAKTEANFQELKIPSCKNVGEESRNSHESDGLGNSVKELQGLKAISGAVHPLLLTRCKSEPARTGERLNPEHDFWKERIR